MIVRTGEIRGQLLPPTVGISHLSGAAAGTTDTSVGRGYVVTNASGTFVSLWASAAGVTAISIMYKDAAGAGVVVCTLPPLTNFVDVPCAMDAPTATRLTAGLLYFKISSSTFPSGTMHTTVACARCYNVVPFCRCNQGLYFVFCVIPREYFLQRSAGARQRGTR